MSKKKVTSTSLPISRTAKIMTSAVGVESVSQDAVAIATKATELFLTDFARRAYELSDSNILDYDDITRLVHSDPRYDFIVDTTPKRIKFSEALKLIEESKKREENLGEDLEPDPGSASTKNSLKRPRMEKNDNDQDDEEQEEPGQNGRQSGTSDSLSPRDSVESPSQEDQ